MVFSDTKWYCGGGVSMMTKGEFIEKFCPCPIGAAWLVDNCENLEKAWIECPRGDWLVWAAIEIEIDEKLLVLTIIECIKIASEHLPELCLEALDDLKDCYLNEKIKACRIKLIADKVDSEWYKVYKVRPSPLKSDKLYMQKRYAVRACKRLIKDVIQEWKYILSGGMLDISLAMSTDDFYCYKTLNRMADICRYNLTSAVMQKLAHM